MTLKEDVTIRKEQFLNQIANEYGFFKTTRDVFIARFAEENASTSNKQIAKNLTMYEYDLQKYLDTICSKFDFASSERGRKRKGQSPWEKAYQWIWNEKYHDFIKQESSIDNKEPEVKIVIDWYLVCSKMLEKQQETQRRHQATSMGFEANVHVSLGLVERKEQQRWEEKEYNHTYEPPKEVITKIYKHGDFLQQVIGKKASGKNKHVAIVGEAGAGKTTLLSQIASFINLQPEYLPIFISLASLRNLTLQDYLFTKWLPEAMGLTDPEITDTSVFKGELIKRFREGRVWLLLDAVDEMTEDSPVHALVKIDKDLKECFWLGEARVVLTCRLNVWHTNDTNINRPLTGFDTYKTQEFKPEEIDKFILNWFTRAERERLQLGKELQAKLKETGHAKIYELVKNPLRLVLLCQIFYYDNRGELPGTKAALYQRYIDYFYKWKLEKYPVELIKSEDLKDKLHQALGRLALAGIGSNYRFQLPRRLCRQEMGEELFQLACDVGWLVLVEITDRDKNKDIFVFWHQNFQEYFAALAIDNWHDFFYHVPDNPDKGTYRIFEPQWKDVILLWFGKEEIKKYNKDEFLQALIDFQDGFKDWDVYYSQAYYLALACLDEFKQSEFNNACGDERCFDVQVRHPIQCFLPSYYEKVSQGKVKVVNIWDIWVNMFERFGFSSEDAWNNFYEYSSSEYKDKKINIFDCLMKKCNKNPVNQSEKVLTLIEIVNNENPKWIHLAAVESLKELLQKQDEFTLVIQELNKYINQHNFHHCDFILDIFEYCAQNMKYPEFYHAWHGEPSFIEILENQFTNRTLQLQLTNKTYPMLINAQPLEKETDISAIAQEICNQIYLSILPDAEIPEVNNAPQFKRLILQIKKQLKTPNLALIFKDCQPNKELISFYRKLTDVLHIALITNHEIEPPMRGFPPNQPNLSSAIQSWINEIE